MVLARSSLETIVQRVRTVPSLPEVVAQISRATQDPTADAKRISDLVTKDPAIAAKMLQMVNSVFYGLREPVHDLTQAVSILGFKTIRSIALSIGVMSSFQQQNACFNMKRFWTHSAVAGGVSRLIAQRAWVMEPEMAFIAGLLRSIGRALLAQNAPEEMRAIIAVAQEFRLPFHEAAREVIKTDDAEIGAWLIGTWELEPLLQRTIAQRYDLAAAEDPGPVALGQFCEHLCALKGLRAPGDNNDSVLDPTVWTHLGIDKNALVDLVSSVNDEVESAKQLLAAG
jgi:HD-like signal output (HDOD) protein